MTDHKPFTLPPGEGAKVCIGGGAGFIGSHIAKRLKESGYHVTVVGACSSLAFSFCFVIVHGRRVGLVRSAGVLWVGYRQLSLAFTY